MARKWRNTERPVVKQSKKWRKPVYKETPTPSYRAYIRFSIEFFNEWRLLCRRHKVNAKAELRSILIAAITDAIHYMRIGEDDLVVTEILALQRAGVPVSAICLRLKMTREELIDVLRPYKLVVEHDLIVRDILVDLVPPPVQSVSLRKQWTEVVRDTE